MNFILLLLLTAAMTGLGFADLDFHDAAAAADAAAADDDDERLLLSAPNLPLGDVNVVVLTDTHSWVAGHGEKEEFNVDYGDVLSFYRLLQEQVQVLEASDPEKYKHDLWFVMNGDWIDGTGLAMNGDPSSLIPILEHMPWDAVNLGNHELYKKSVIEYMTRPGGFVQWFGSNYLTSNVIFTETKKNVGKQYRILNGKHSKVLVFGFLYNMKSNDKIVTVTEVQDTVNEAWFEVALTELEYDAIMVLAHCGYDDPIILTILNRIRQFKGHDMPVQFIAGHTHIRANAMLDAYSSSFEAGRYLDTIGFVSFPTQTTIQTAAQAKQAAAEKKAAAEAFAANNNTNGSSSSTNSTEGSNYSGTSATEAPSTESEIQYHDEFQHVFIDAKYDTLKSILGRESITTEDGTALSSFIFDVRQDLGLFKVVGCVNENYLMENAVYESNSIWGLFCNHVVPHAFPWEIRASQHLGNPAVFLLNQGAFRYDLFAKDLTLDEVIAVSPFNDTLYMFSGIPGSVLTQVNASLNKNGPNPFLPKVPENIMCRSPATNLPQPGDPEAKNHPFDLVAPVFQVESIRKELADAWPNDTLFELPNPQKIPDKTSTSIWLEFFDETNLCQTKNKGTYKTPTGKNNGNKTPEKPHNHNNKNGTSLGSQFFGKETVRDEFRVAFVWVAVIIVIVFTGVYIRQRSIIWRSKQNAREMATRLALEEYNEQNGIGGDSYRDHNDGENGFVNEPRSEDEADDIRIGLRYYNNHHGGKLSGYLDHHAQDSKNDQHPHPHYHDEQTPAGPGDLLDYNEAHRIGQHNSNSDMTDFSKSAEQSSHESDTDILELL